MKQFSNLKLSFFFFRRIRVNTRSSSWGTSARPTWRASSSSCTMERSRLVHIKLFSAALKQRNFQPSSSETSGQSYKHFTLVNYDFRVIPDLKTPHIMTLESYITIVKCFIILTTDVAIKNCPIFQKVNQKSTYQQFLPVSDMLQKYPKTSLNIWATLCSKNFLQNRPI